MFAGKRKNKTESFQFCSLGPAVKAARPTPARAQSRARPRTQAATWAWAGKVARRSRPPGLSLAQSCSAVGSHPTVAQPFRSDKTPTPRALWKTLGHFHSLLSLSSSPLSPLSTSSLLSRVQPSERERAKASMAPPPPPSPACALPSG